MLLVSGSYTCDASRHNLSSLNKLAREYKDKVAIYVVYIIDAHPRDTISPYSLNHGKWLSTANIAEHVEADQPRTYEQRKALAARWQQQYRIAPPVLVDSPDNAFWINFSQAPNMVYLIEPDGTVGFKGEWYRPKDVETAVANTFHTE